MTASWVGNLSDPLTESQLGIAQVHDTQLAVSTLGHLMLTLSVFTITGFTFFKVMTSWSQEEPV